MRFLKKIDALVVRSVVWSTEASTLKFALFLYAPSVAVIAALLALVIWC